jgi:hypothetical protein
MDEFLDRVNVPIGMEPVEFLKTFMPSDQAAQTENTETSNAPLYPLVKYIHIQKPVISEEMFTEFNFYFEVGFVVS